MKKTLEAGVSGLDLKRSSTLSRIAMGGAEDREDVEKPPKRDVPNEKAQSTHTAPRKNPETKDFTVLPSLYKAALEYPEEEVAKWHKKVKQVLETKFSRLTDAFRDLDKDHSGSLNHAECRQALIELNVGVPPVVLESLVIRADLNGDGSVDYREFARLLTAEKLPELPRASESKTQSSDAGGADQADAAPKQLVHAVTARTFERQVEAVPDADVTRYHGIIATALTTKFDMLKKAFRSMDTDHSGELSHAECRWALANLNLGIPEPVLERIVKLADVNGDGFVNYAEFARLLTADDVLQMKPTLSAASL